MIPKKLNRCMGPAPSAWKRYGVHAICFINPLPFLALLFCGILSLTTSRLRATPLTGDLGLLTETADAIQRNFDHLKTWQGDASIEVTNQGHSSFRAISSAHFVYDRDADALRWTVRMLSEALDGHDSSPFIVGGMLKENRIYRFHPYPADRPRPQGLGVMISPRPQTPRNPIKGWGDEFSPIAHWKQIGEDSAQSLRWYRENANNADLIGGTISKQGTLITLAVGHDGTGNRYTFDTTQGSSLTEYYTFGEKSETRYSIKFASFNGVFIPVSSTYLSSSTSDDHSKEAMQVQVSFSAARVNEGLGGDAFSLASLGLRDGDHVQDDVTGLSYTYGASPALPDAGGHPVAATQGTNRTDAGTVALVAPAPIQTGYSIWHIALISLLALALGSGAVYWLRKARNTPPEN